MNTKLQYDRVRNFNAGPAAIPFEVLERVNEQWFNYQSSGMNVMEMSHRAKEFDDIHNEAIATLKRLLGVGDDYHVLFLQGGASTQFGMLAMNFLAGGKADYINTGVWSKKAIKEAKLFGDVNVAFDGDTVDFKRLPKQEELQLSADAKYVHITSNNTIKGTQFREFPDVNGKPMICDMSSDILSHPIDANKFAMIYAGAQKNLGPSGVTVVVIRDDFYKTAQADGLTTMLKYSTHLEKNSLFNTPPTFAIYLMGEVLKWVEENGGAAGMADRNTKKADILYGLFDEYNDFFRCPIEKDSRSWMNVCFRLVNEDLEATLIKEAKEAGYVGLKGHRSVGGLRASTYNACSVEAVEDLAGFLKDFMKNNG